MNLTAMQEKAALEFYRTKNWERAARFAGYKSTSAASELRCNPAVCERVKQLEQDNSLADYATRPHCTDLLVRAALGQMTEIKVGNEKFQVKIGSKIRKQVFLDDKGNVRSTTISFEHDPLKALELLMKLKGWFDNAEEAEPVDRNASLERVMAALRKMRERGAEKA